MMLDPQEIVEQAGLYYMTDAKPGITRKKRGKQFEYFDKSGAKITDEKVLSRVKSLAVPPAYRDVWICPRANGHIQATGIDERGRKQYRYHAKWRAARDESKFEHMLHFGEILPMIRKRVEKDIKREGLSREKVLATVVQLLEKTLIRVGNAEYAKENNSYGLTTIRRKHVKVRGNEIRFQFMGKSGKQWNLSLNDRRIAAVVKHCADIPGHELFKYIDDEGNIRDVSSGDVNSYLKEISGEELTAKDFRTWSGTVLAAIALSEFEKYDSQAQAKKNVLRAIEHVSKQLGNTPAICRKCYIHPEVLGTYLNGEFSEMIEQQIDKEFKGNYDKLTDEEIMVLAFLRNRLDKRK